MDYVPPSNAIHEEVTVNQFRMQANAAQYKGSDYLNAVRVERDISLDQAFEIAKSDPNIDYFVYVKGYQMVLEVPPDVQFDPEKDPLKLVTYNHYIFNEGGSTYGPCRIFHQGDVVFFKKEGMWLGEASGLADTYFK